MAELIRSSTWESVHAIARHAYGPTADLIGFQFGDFFVEQAIHAGLVEHRARGREWYHPHPAVLSVVNDMRADLGLPGIAA